MGMLVDKCEDYRSVDLAWLRRKGCFKLGYSGRITWSRGGSVTAWINYRVEASGLRLIYRTRRNGEEWRDIDELFPFLYTATYFSGHRRWLQCPSCNHRCRVLYGGAYFRCRRCHGLRYESQYEPAWLSGTSRAQKIRERYGGSGSLDEPFPEKPKGMHGRTYKRLIAEDERLTSVWMRNMSQRLGIR
jgi:alpha-amylase/alpha-mannosidase (GH57 family)